MSIIVYDPIHEQFPYTSFFCLDSTHGLNKLKLIKIQA